MRIILLLLPILFLQGCMFTKTVYVPVVEIKYENIPTVLLVDDIEIPEPPEREKFIKANPIEREQMLTKVVIDLYSSMKLYKLKLANIAEFDDNASKIVKE
ncbi:MAG: hypothetical protein DRJ64_01650 [Thermoprotei archaeon]|nr:MAG: hypothetical protein DRJ64_01650 [Thermoprotei archaeon]